MKRKILLSGIIQVVVVLVFLSTITGAYISNNQKIILSCITIGRNIHSGIGITQNIVWDNGMNSYGAFSSQYCSIYGEIGLVADDFLFENDTKLTGVKWIGAYWHPDEDRDFDMEIILYYNRSEGNMPGDIYAGPFFYLNEETNETQMEDNWYFSYNVSLTEPILFLGGEKYWISIQSIGDIFPQWGTGVHEIPQQLANLCWKGEYVGVYDWEHVHNWDMSFQLTGEENLPPTEPYIDGPASGRAGVNYSWIFHSTDPNSDDIYYYIEWGDNTSTGWIGLFTSGENATVNHTWDEKGTYTIKAKAKDIYGAESNWTEFVVTMSRDKATNNMLLLRILERFPLLEKLLLIIK